MSKIKENLINNNAYDYNLDFDLDEDFLYEEFIWKQKSKELYDNLDKIYNSQFIA